MKKIEIKFRLNGNDVSARIDPGKRLIDMLREDFHLTSVKEGCGEGECGTCTVLRNEEAVTSCMILAGQVSGDDIMTVEGLMKNAEIDAVQRAFIECDAIQCGFCSPGMILSVKALLLKNPHPTKSEIKRAIAGNLCRCSGYQKIIRAAEKAALIEEEA